MCGFTGFIDFSNTFYNYEKILNKCSDDLSFRGPDQFKNLILAEKKIYLTFQRLAFTDLSTNAMQPMLSYNKNYLIMFNGEIYNHLSLKKNIKLNKKDNELNSDTRIALEYISFYGIQKFIEDVDGMFSIIFISFLENKIFLISDIFSQKPLYYAYNDKILYFSSDIRTIRNHPAFNLKINKNALSLYFRKNYIPSPLTIYENVNKIEPSNIIEFKFENKIQFIRSRFYNNFFEDNYEEQPFQTNKLKKLIEDSVFSQMISDSEIGTFLSSGIDSSLVTSISSKINPNLRTFSMGFSNQLFDESNQAKKIANYLNVKNHQIIFDEKKLEENVLSIPSIYSEPFSDSSQIPYAQLCCFASNYTKGILSGDGGDELFGGYYRHRFLPFMFKNKDSKIFLFFLKLFKNKNFKLLFDILGLRYHSEKVSRVLKALSSENLPDFYDNFTSHHEFNNIVLNGLNAKISKIDNIILNKDFYKNILILDQKYYLPNDLMVKSDRASMFSSLEVRSPLLSNNILKYFKSKKYSDIFFDYRTKPILRDLLKKYLPNKLILNQKKGFIVPVDKWLKSNLKNLLDHSLSKKNLDHDLLDYNLINTNLEDFKNGKMNHYALWDLLIFQLWFKKYHS